MPFLGKYLSDFQRLGTFVIGEMRSLIWGAHKNEFKSYFNK